MATGPFNKTITTYWSGTAGPRKTYEAYTWYRNGPGHRVPHPLTQVRCIATKVGSDAPNINAGYYAQDAAGPAPWAGYSADVHNRCYAKYIEQARGVSSQLGATAAEWSQSERMIAQRAGQMTKAFRALRRGLPFEFFKELGMLHRMPRRLPRRSDPKKAGDLWLEWHFGWVPLVGDIHDSVQVLQKPIPDLIKVKARARSGPLFWDTSSQTATRIRTNYLYGEYREQIGARVRVSNPNMLLANSLGLVNPVGVLWEVVPFSFVVDWFIPVAQFIDAWTDTLGLEIAEPYTTISREFRSYQKSIRKPSGPVEYEYEGKGWRYVRSVAIQGPSLTFRPWKAPSMTRAATAISLLLQQFALAGKRAT